MEYELEKELRQMCNLSEAIEEKALQEGFETNGNKHNNSLYRFCVSHLPASICPAAESLKTQG